MVESKKERNEGERKREEKGKKRKEENEKERERKRKKEKEEKEERNRRRETEEKRQESRLDFLSSWLTRLSWSDFLPKILIRLLMVPIISVPLSRRIFFIFFCANEYTYGYLKFIYAVASENWR